MVEGTNQMSGVEPARKKRWILLAALIGALLVALLILTGIPRATTGAVAMTFVGYTNQPGNPVRFALFSVSNQAPHAVRWRGSWVEVEGKPGHKAEIMNPTLPGFARKPTLKAGGSLTLAIGEPSDESENGRWRYAMSYVAYSLQGRWLDFSMRHNLPIVLVDAQRILNPSNNVTVTTAWLGK